jgi:hypothetical protein
MKQHLSLRAIVIFLLSTSIITSCEKAQELSEKKHSECTTDFNGESMSCSTARQVIYHFISSTDENNITIQGDLINFTGADPVVAVSGATLNVTQIISANAANRTVRLEGSVTACQGITVTINWHSTNPGGIITGDWTVKDKSKNDLAPAVLSMKCSDE